MSPRPNVLFLFSDDHGYADRSALGIDPAVRTPALDRLAGDGVTCTNAYVTAPICSPSRAGLIAGQYQARWGARWFDDSVFPYDRPSLAERFRDQGYATGYLGKVHYGPEDVGDRACPPHHGFDECYYGLAGKQMGRLNYLLHSRAAVDAYGPEASWRMAVQPMLEAGPDGETEAELDATLPGRHSNFLTAELGGRARDFIGRHENEPFFLMVAFNAVHNFCFQLPDEELKRRGLAQFGNWDPAVSSYVDWYDGAIWPNLPDGRAYYLVQLELMDEQIGLLLDELDRRGLAENTIVVYCTDNGGSTCNFGVNTPLSGTKYTLYEGGIRIPYLVRWPAGGVDGGRTYDGLTSTLDLYPTLLSAVGAPPETWSHSDGLDQLPGLRGEPAGSAAGGPGGAAGGPGRVGHGHEALHWDCGFQWAVREGNWKLRSADAGPHRDALLRTEHTDIGIGLTLTDLAADIGETRDLSAERPDVVERLTARHETWRREVGLAPA